MKITIEAQAAQKEWNDHALTASTLNTMMGEIEISIHDAGDTCENPIATVRVTFDQFLDFADAIRYGMAP